MLASGDGYQRGTSAYACGGWDPARHEVNEGVGASLADAEHGWGLGVELCRVLSRL